MTTYEITDHHEDQTFTAETLQEIVAHYTYSLHETGDLNEDTKKILDDIEHGTIDNGLLRAVLGFEIHPVAN